MEKHEVQSVEAKQKLMSFLSPVWQSLEPLRPGFTLPGAVCGVLVSERIKNVGAELFYQTVFLSAFALLVEVDVSFDFVQK